MLDNLGQLGEVLAVVLSIVAVAAAIGTGLLHGTVVRLRGVLNDARGEIDDKDRRLKAAEARVAILENDLAALTRVVTGEVHWVAIADKLDAHHEEAKTHWQRNDDLLTNIKQLLEGEGRAEHKRRS